MTVTQGKDQRNPHMFYVTLSGPQVLGSAKVKVELWQAQAAALQSLQLKKSPRPLGRRLYLRAFLVICVEP